MLSWELLLSPTLWLPERWLGVLIRLNGRVSIARWNPFRGILFILNTVSVVSPREWGTPFSWGSVLFVPRIDSYGQESFIWSNSVKTWGTSTLIFHLLLLFSVCRCTLLCSPHFSFGRELGLQFSLKLSFRCFTFYH